MTCTQPSAQLKRHLRQAMNNTGSTSELVTLLSCLIAASSTDATPTVVTATPYVVLDSDTILLVDVAAAIITLPAGVDLTSKRLVIKDRAGSATGQPLTVNPDGVETIDAVASLSIDRNYASVTLIFQGSNWSLV